MKHFQASLPATMAGLAAKSGLKLAFGSPRTDGKVVYVTPPPINPSEKDRILILGDLIHEIAHVRETDFSVLQGGTLHPTVRNLLNVFEDVRIEREVRSYYLGAEHYLSGSYDIVMEKVSIQQRYADMPTKVFPDLLLSRYFWLDLGRNQFKSHFDQLYQLALQLFPADLLQAAFDLCDPRVPAMKSSQDALALAEDLFELLKQKHQEHKEPSAQQQNQGKSESRNANANAQEQHQQGGDAAEGDQQDAQGQEEGGTDKAADDSGDDAGAGASSSSDEESQDSNAEASASGSDENSNGDDACSTDSDKVGDEKGKASDSSQSSASGCSDGGLDPEHIADSLIAEAYKQEVSDLAYAYPETWTSITNWGEKIDLNLKSCTVPFPPISRQEKPHWVDEVLREKAKSRSRFSRLWNSTNQRRQVRSDQAGYFSHREAVRCIASGEQDYLIRRTRQQDNRPAVVVLVDVSSSMKQREKIKHAKKATALINELAGELRFPLSIIAYWTQSLLVKDWSDSTATARERIYELRAVGGTEILPAFWAGYAAAMNAPKQPVKIILITDGKFARYEEVALHEASKEIQAKHPFDIYGLGIDVEMDYLEKAGKIYPEDLAESMLDILAK